VLTEPRTRRRRQQSLRQEYGEFILERIEEFKDHLSREELLALADEAVRELEVGPEGQLVLTEILVLEHVDRLIMRRLNLPTLRRWRERHVRLRRAQREPTHWGLDRRSPLVRLAESFDDPDVALVVGSAASPAGLFLAAYEWPVVFIDRHISSVEAAETRAAAEALARWFQAYVVSLGDWFPDVEPALTILDAATLTGLSRDSRERFLDTLLARTIPGGVHFVLPQRATEGTGARLRDLLRAQYRHWQIDQPGETSAPRWFLAVKP
jgi:hypothetical protein